MAFVQQIQLSPSISFKRRRSSGAPQRANSPASARTFSWLPSVLRKRSDSKEMQPVHMRLLCRLQLRDCHAHESNRVSGVDHDYRACL